MKFLYKAKTKDGQIVEGEMESQDRLSLAHELRLKGEIPISISQSGKNIFGSMNALSFLGGVSIQEQILFTKNVSGMLKAGLSLSRALSVLKKQTRNSKFEEILDTLSKEIDSGGNLSSGLAKFPKIFSKLFISMVRSGEESGNLVGVLSEVGVSLEKAHALTKRVKGAMIYPGVIMSAMIIIGILMFAFVVPTLSNTFKAVGANLPATTRFILSLGDFFSKNLAVVFLGLFAAGTFFYFLFKADFMQKYIDFVTLKLPFIGTMSKEINTARTARTISSLLSSGVSITRSLEIAYDVVQNTYHKKVLGEAKERIEKGMPFYEIFSSNTNLFPVMMAEMVQVGEETGKLSDMLMQIALFYEEEVENRTKNLSTIIEPVLMMIIGSAVGFFAVSMIKPIYSILDKVK